MRIILDFEKINKVEGDHDETIAILTELERLKRNCFIFSRKASR